MMNLSLLTKLFLILAVLFTAPGFVMSENHGACISHINVSSEHHPSKHSSIAHDFETAPQPHHNAENYSANHCVDASHCMLCFSVLPSVTLSVTQADSYKPDSAVLNNWLSRTLKPEPYPPRNYLA